MVTLTTLTSHSGGRPLARVSVSESGHGDVTMRGWRSSRIAPTFGGCDATRLSIATTNAYGTTTDPAENLPQFIKWPTRHLEARST